MLAMRLMASVLGLGFGLVFGYSGAAHASPAASCAPGDFLVAGSPLGSGQIPDSEVIVLAASEVSIRGVCGPTTMVTRRKKRAIVIVGRWKRRSCAPYKRAMLRLSIDKATCNRITGTFTTVYSRVPSARRFRATRQETVQNCRSSEDTFALIQERIFGGHGCAVASCHGSYAQGGLQLLAGTSYAQLVGVPATNAAATAAGKVRVLPGMAADSFLVQKLRGNLTPAEGDAMPRVGTPLDAEELALVEAWIEDGAPSAGRTSSTPCLSPKRFAPAVPLAPPAGGYQLLFDGPMVQPGEEREICMWVATPNATPFTVGRWEFSLNPGTHHFAVFQWDKPGAPQALGALGTDPGCISGAMFGATLSGSPQAPYFVDALPPGLGRVLPAGGYLGLNAHYANAFDQPIQMKVWVNMYPYPGTPEHLVETLTDFNDMFSINVPPNTQRLLQGRFTNTKGVPMAFVQLQGHMHKRGLRFTAYASDGAKILENLDWAHPFWRPFDPPLVLAPGDYLDFECLHDNGVTRPPKLDASGRPTTLVFGVTSDDEMCTLSGVWYPVQ
jgi:hypothetical protein